MKAISVCGYHHTGKTTVCEVLIKGLSDKGYQVTSIKDIHFEDFSMEKSGSNSDRHCQAGAEPVFARGVKETDLIWQRKLNFNEMLPYIKADWLIVEGMRDLAMPRIICGSDQHDLNDFMNSTVMAVSGKFADNNSLYQNLPVISAVNDSARLIDLVEKQAFELLPQVDPECCSHCGMSCHEFVGAVLRNEKKRSDCVAENLGKARIWINDSEVKLVPFVQNIIHDTMEALLSNLKGYEKGNIRIEYNNQKE